MADRPFFPTGVTTENREWRPGKPPEFPVFLAGGKAPVRQGCRLQTIPPVSQAASDLPGNNRKLRPYSAHNRAKNGNGEFRRVYWQTARECGSAAISRGRGITRISRICTLAMGVPQRIFGAGVENPPGFQHCVNPRIPPVKTSEQRRFFSVSHAVYRREGLTRFGQRRPFYGLLFWHITGTSCLFLPRPQRPR